MSKHPQNSPRGLLAKHLFVVPAGKGIMFDSYSTGSNLLSANGTGLKVAGSILLAGYSERTSLIAANTTGLKVRGGAIIGTDVSSALPTSEDKGIAMQLIENSTGVAVVLNTTGTTWKFLHTTDAQGT